MDELSCPRCRMTKYRNPSLRLLINTCGHALCEACVELIFTRESAPCPDCGRTLKRNGFRTQMFEDTRVDKEVDIRRSILKIYNKQEDDFATLRDYNDYLEEVEEIIWNLESGRNEKEMKEKIANYREENEAIIRRNQVRITQERSYFKEQLAREAKEQQLRAQLLSQMDKEAEVARKRGQENLLNDLTNNTDLSSAEVLARHKKIKVEDEHSRTLLEERMQTATFNNAMTTEQGGFDTTSSHTTDTQYEYTPLEIDIIGPDMPDRNALYDTGYLRHVREATSRDRGGGYDSVLACERALFEAFGGLFVSPESKASEVM